jgi:hypothetical protein
MIKLKIDLTKLTGAKLMKSNSGKPIVVIDLENSRTFQAKSGAVYADLCVVERKEVGESLLGRKVTLETVIDPSLATSDVWAQSDGVL